MREGNAGVYITIKMAPDQTSFELEVDTNATYREYIIIIPTDSKHIRFIVTSDDLCDNSAIEVICENADPENVTYKLNYSERRTSSLKVESPRQGGGSLRRWFAWLRRGGSLRRGFAWLRRGDSKLS